MRSLLDVGIVPAFGKAGVFDSTVRSALYYSDEDTAGTDTVQCRHAPNGVHSETGALVFATRADTLLWLAHVTRKLLETAAAHSRQHHSFSLSVVCIMKIHLFLYLILFKY